MKSCLNRFVVGLTLALPLQVFAQDPTNVVSIPDEQLRNGIVPGSGGTNTEVLKSQLLGLREVAIAAPQVCRDGCSFPEGQVSDLTGLEEATRLRELYLRGGKVEGHALTSLAPIKELKRLAILRLPNSLKGTAEQKFQMIEDLSGLNRIRDLSLEQNGLNESQLAPLVNLNRLRWLDIDDNDISHLDFLTGLPQIRRLDIDDNPIEDFGPLEKLQYLRDLDFTALPSVLQTLPGIRSLRFLKANLNDLGPIARCANLRHLDIASGIDGSPLVSRIYDLTPLANLPHLEWTNFSMTLSTQVRDVRAVGFEEDTTEGAVFWPSRRNLISALARNSELSLEDPATAEIFDRLGLDEFSITPRPCLDVNGRYLCSAELDLSHLAGRSDLTEISALNGWVTDLTPLADLTQLQKIVLSNNFISDVSPLTGLENTEIDLRGNPIDFETVPTSWLNNERVLLDAPQPELDDTQLIPDPSLRSLITAALRLPGDTELTTEHLGELRTLYADYGAIRSLEGLQHATNLLGLSVRNNLVKDLTPVLQLPLRWFRVSGNRLDADDTSGLTEMAARGVVIDDEESGRFLSAITAVDGVVFADDYQLSSLRFLRLFPEVETLFLSHNYFVEIGELENLAQLEKVYLEGNLIPANSEVVANLRTRGVQVVFGEQRANLSYEHQISHLNFREAIADGLGMPFVPPAFSEEELRRIARFDWERSRKNSLFRVGEEIPEGEFVLVGRMTNLKYLSLERTGIRETSFLSELTQLNRIDLDFNQLENLEGLALMTQLTELDANDNFISQLEQLGNLSELELVDLDSNQLKSLGMISAFTKVDDLQLNDNQISNFDGIDALSLLGELRCENNRISTLSGVGNLPELYLLCARRNGIDYQELAEKNTFAFLRERIPTAQLYPQFSSALFSSERRENELILSWLHEPENNTQIDFSLNLMIWSPMDQIIFRNNTTEPESREISIPFERGGSRYYRVRVWPERRNSD